jgi:excisionase family DNA binding protein
METADIIVTADSEPALLIVEEVAQRMRLPRTAVYRLISSGALISLKLGRHRRIPSWAVDQFIRQAVEEQKQHVTR